MSNFKYRFVDKDIVVSADEHEKILGAMEKGRKTAVLRNGALIINFGFIGVATPTTEPTDEQIAIRKNPALEAPDRSKEVQDRLKKDHDAFYERMHWEHKPNCSCKQQ